MILCGGVCVFVCGGPESTTFVCRTQTVSLCVYRNVSECEVEEKLYWVINKLCADMWALSEEVSVARRAQIGIQIIF